MKSGAIDYDRNLVSCRMLKGKPLSLAVCVVRRKDLEKHPECEGCGVGEAVMERYKRDVEAGGHQAAGKKAAADLGDGSRGKATVKKMCSECGEKPVFCKGKCATHYYRDLRERRREEKKSESSRAPATKAASAAKPRPSGGIVTITIALDADRLERAMDRLLGCVGVERSGGQDAEL